MEEKKVIFSSGQKRVYKEGERAAFFPKTPYEPVPVIHMMKPLEFHPKFTEKDYVPVSDVTEELISITPAMLDWWRANMEKGYHLWVWV